MNHRTDRFSFRRLGRRRPEPLIGRFAPSVTDAGPRHTLPSCGRWGKRTAGVPARHEPEYQLEELALMTVSAEWLTRWLPISMHWPLLAGATPDQMVEAAGTSVPAMFEQ